MHRIKWFIISVLFLPTVCLATWQIAGEPTRTVSDTPVKYNPGIPAQWVDNPHYDFYTNKGYIYPMVYQYAANHYWKLQWMAPRNLMNQTKTKYAGPGFKQVLNSMLDSFGLKAQYSDRTHTVTVANKNF